MTRTVTCLGCLSCKVMSAEVRGACGADRIGCGIGDILERGDIPIPSELGGLGSIANSPIVVRGRHPAANANAF